jgi:hypothetical protein
MRFCIATQHPTQQRERDGEQSETREVTAAEHRLRRHRLEPHRSQRRGRELIGDQVDDAQQQERRDAEVGKAAQPELEAHLGQRQRGRQIGRAWVMPPAPQSREKVRQVALRCSEAEVIEVDARLHDEASTNTRDHDVRDGERAFSGAGKDNSATMTSGS